MLGANGGLFALGAVLGAAGTYAFMVKVIFKKQLELLEAKYDAQLQAMAREIEFLNKELERVQPIVDAYIDKLKRESMRYEVMEALKNDEENS
jgi:hypothetical protein